MERKSRKRPRSKNRKFICAIVLGLYGGVLVAGKGPQQWLLSEAARSFPGSNSDLPLAKAEPVSDGGSASVITYLRRGKR